MEVEVLGDGSKLGHVLGVAAWVGGDEIRDDLLVESLLAVDAVKDGLEAVEEVEGGLAHQVEDVGAGVLRSHFQASADMARDELARVFLRRSVGLLVLAAMEQQVVAHARSDKTLLDAGERIDGMVDVEQLLVTGVEVGTDLGMDAGGALAVLAGLEIAPVHAVHIGRRTSEVAEVAFEPGHLNDLAHLAQDVLLRPAGDKLALVGGDGAEGAAAEAATMDVDAKLDHLEGGDGLALVLRVGIARVGQVEGGVELLGRHRRIGRIDHGEAPIDALEDAAGVALVGFLLDMAEVFGLKLLVAQALLVGVEDNVVLADASGNVLAAGEEDGLRHVAHVADLTSLLQLARNGNDRLLAHAIDEQVGSAIAEDALHQAVLPIVVVGEAAHARLDTSQHHGHVGIDLLQDARIDDRGILRALVVATVGRILVAGTEAAVGGVFVDHGVHGARRDAEEEARTTQLLEVAVVAVPVGLRDDGHAVASLQRAANDGYAKGWMIDIGVARKEDDVELVPAAQLTLLLRRGKEVGELKLGCVVVVLLC